jgi:predicted enzyme related to lactoylglutathione lyase
MITNVKTVAVYASDQREAVRFYTEKLGFEVRRNQPMGPGGNWIEVAPPGAQSRVVIYPRDMMKDWQERKPSIVLGCEDVEATHRELSESGVTFTQEPKKMPWGTFAVFADPDGNEFVLTEGE